MKNITITSHTFAELVGNKRKTIITYDDSIRVGDTVYIRPESAGDDKKYAYASVEWIANTPAWRILGLKGIEVGTD